MISLALALVWTYPWLFILKNVWKALYAGTVGSAYTPVIYKGDILALIFHSSVRFPAGIFLANKTNF